MSPTTTPTPTPIEFSGIPTTPQDDLVYAVSHLAATAHADLDSLLAAADGGVTFPLPIAPAISITVKDWSVTFAATPLPISLGTALAALLGTALVVIALVALHRVTSPEAQARRAAKRDALHAFYTERLHAEQAARRAADRRNAERLRAQERAATAAVLLDEDEEPRP